jgi:hypothetical protein
MPGLLRPAPLAREYTDLPSSALERSSACIYCHTPRQASGPSSAAIWAGRGAIDPLTLLPLLGPAPHASVPGGCLGCHGSDRADPVHGSGHTFRATRRRCLECHAEREASPNLFERARRLLEAYGVGPRSEIPPHASNDEPDTIRERALALARFVLEDRGAAVHNPRYAEALLDRAEQILRPPSP